ncbi:MAG: GYF domain-containing protein [Planctomycetaceae bacterium]|nr:GYF domain-containing protein [Planctomycetaceae bacterium]
MANWFYYDNNGQKLGPINNALLKALAAKGVILPETIVETETGRRGRAEKVNGLTFVATQLETIQAAVPAVPPIQNVSNNPQSFDNTDGIVMVFNGYGAKLDVYPDKVIITRSGVLSFFVHGLKGAKTLYYHHITGLQIKMPDFMGNRGYLQFSIQGGKESTGGLWAAAADENTVIFNKDQNEQAQKVHSFIEKKLIESHRPAQTAAPVQASTVDELKKMKELLDIGAVSPEEFYAFKRKILGI